MPTATIGPWEFEMPDGWVFKESEASDSYFEGPDGTQGLYVKAIEFSTPRPTPQELASHIQDIHFRNFAEAKDSAWEVADRSDSDGVFCRSRLDLYDHEASYRVLSLVLCDTRQAIQLSVHDYLCEDYAAAREAFRELENSVEYVSGAV
jgi:hypothetical protein